MATDLAPPHNLILFAKIPRMPFAVVNDESAYQVDTGFLGLYTHMSNTACVSNLVE